MPHQNHPKKILLLGATCTGKSTLAKKLAQHYNSVWVEEYLRLFVDGKPLGYLCQYEDLEVVARGQIALENKRLAAANRFLFCDTSLIQLFVYSHFYFDKSPKFINEMLPKLHYDVILLTDNIGVEWEDDPQRDNKNSYEIITKRLIETLDNLNLPFYKISGNVDERIKTVEKLLKDY